MSFRTSVVSGRSSALNDTYGCHQVNVKKCNKTSADGNTYDDPPTPNPRAMELQSLPSSTSARELDSRVVRILRRFQQPEEGPGKTMGGNADSAARADGDEADGPAPPEFLLEIFLHSVGAQLGTFQRLGTPQPPQLTHVTDEDE